MELITIGEERAEILTPFGRVAISKRSDTEHLVEIILRPGTILFGPDNTVFDQRFVGRIIRYNG